MWIDIDRCGRSHETVTVEIDFLRRGECVVSGRVDRGLWSHAGRVGLNRSVQSQREPGRRAAGQQIDVDRGIRDLTAVDLSTQDEVIHRTLNRSTVRHNAIQKRFCNQNSQVVVEQPALQCVGQPITAVR